VSARPYRVAAARPDDLPAANPWTDVAESLLQTQSAQRLIVPDRYRTVALDRAALEKLLAQAPVEGRQAARSSAVILALPLPDGTFGRFQIVESPIMAPELAAKYPQIKTYTGQGLDDPTATVRFDRTPQGFHAMILTAGDSVFIDPYSRNDVVHYISYYKRDYQPPDKAAFIEYPPVDPGGQAAAAIGRLLASGPLAASGTVLRTYRLAVAATGEYTAFQGGTVELGLAAIVTSINRVDGIYEREVAVRLSLIANDDLLVYTDAETDPYTNNNPSALLTENQANIDAVIGSANYDIGHVFSTAGGGLAGLGVVCVNPYKAKGETGTSHPIGDPFDVDYVAHEMGHQFGANHTFNSLTGACGQNKQRNASTAYEPGSGSTIMGYAGICGADDLQPHSDDYFHTISYDEIVAYTTAGSGSICPVTTATGNHPPVPNGGAGGFTIPANTPFALTGSATDPDGDPLTYNWEEFDLGAPGVPDNPTNPPFFRSWPATSDPTRTFPRLSDLVNNTTVIGEVLPNGTRALNFRLTVRDNRSGGGGVDYRLLTFNVTTAAGPFQVTAPNTAVTWPGNSTQTITWTVANTAAAPVSCANVDILLSTDGGLTYPITLLAGTPNDGSQAVLVPEASSTAARVKVACSNSIFFDISDVDFTLTATPITAVAPASLSSTQPADVQVTRSLTISNTGLLDLTWLFEEEAMARPAALAARPEIIAAAPCATPGDIPWLTETPISGTVAPAAATVVTVTLDSTGQAPGTYSGNLCLSSNDPNDPLVATPVTLTVCAAPITPTAVSLAITGTDNLDLLLSWTDDPANSGGYEVYGGTEPYFAPDAATLVASLPAGSTSYTDAGRAGGTDNYFYVVRGVNGCGIASGDSARVGLFHVPLVPGS